MHNKHFRKKNFALNPRITLYKEIEGLSLSLNLDSNIVRVNVWEASLASEHGDEKASVLSSLDNTPLEGPNLIIEIKK